MATASHDQGENPAADRAAASLNYFNYFTEIEEYFWRKRGAHLLVSPLDWAIVETWQKAGIPLDAVLAGIDSAFESYQRSRRSGGRPLKSLAYCVDAVLDAAAQKSEAAAGTGPQAPRRTNAEDTFSRQEVVAFLRRNGERLQHAETRLDPGNELARRIAQTRSGVTELATEIESGGDSAPGPPIDLEDLERRLTVFEEKLAAAITSDAPEQLMLDIRRDLDRQLAPHRRRMSAAQLAQLERQYLQKRLFEHFGLPRLSLFYLT